LSTIALRAVGSYRQTEVQSRTPLELVVLLYDGAITFATAARTAIERHDVPGRTGAISRAMAIISELQSTLDLERGGAVAESLDGLYSYVSGRLVDASFKRDARALDEVIGLLTPLRDAWSAIAPGTVAQGARVAR
jgi:flagellar protein FliS